MIGCFFVLREPQLDHREPVAELVSLFEVLDREEYHGLLTIDLLEVL